MYLQVLSAKKLTRAMSKAVLKGVWREEEDTDVERMLLRIKARMEK